jgi:hypothetical protein
MVLACVALAVEIVNFPTGRPMREGDGSIQPIHRRD